MCHCLVGRGSDGVLAFDIASVNSSRSGLLQCRSSESASVERIA